MLIPSPSNSTAPPTPSSVAGSSSGSDLTIIHVEDGRLIHSHTCSSTMTKIFTKMIHPNGYAWKNVPNEYKDLYFEEFKEEVQARHDIATQEAEDSTESANINMSQLYVDVVGAAKKQCIYGLGTKGSSFINGNSCGSPATSQLHQSAMKDMMNQQLETMRADMEAKLQAEMTQIHTQIHAQITSLMDELRRNGILSTSMPLPQNTQQAENSVNSNDKNLGDD
nr:probable inactive protein kinase DDB_G0270444 [Ipomoea batatas]